MISLQFNKKPEFSFPPKDHVELGLALDIVDFDSAAEVLTWPQRYSHLLCEGLTA